MASGIMSPPKWDQKMKDFELWLRKVKAWKVETSNVVSLKDVNGPSWLFIYLKVVKLDVRFFILLIQMI